MDHVVCVILLTTKAIRQSLRIYNLTIGPFINQFFFFILFVCFIFKNMHIQDGRPIAEIASRGTIKVLTEC